MATGAPRPRGFLPSRWPFSGPVDALAFYANKVLFEDFSTRRAGPYNAEDRQVPCDPTNGSKDGLVVCQGHGCRWDPNCRPMGRDRPEGKPGHVARVVAPPGMIGATQDGSRH